MHKTIYQFYKKKRRKVKWETLNTEEDKRDNFVTQKQMLNKFF